MLSCWHINHTRLCWLLGYRNVLNKNSHLFRTDIWIVFMNTGVFKVYHSKTLLLVTQKFVSSRTQHFCHIWKILTCIDLTQVLVLKWHHKSCVTHTQTHLKTSYSNTPKRRASLWPLAPKAGVVFTELSLTRLTMTLLLY